MLCLPADQWKTTNLTGWWFFAPKKRNAGKLRSFLYKLFGV
jgi:hypothetical protein